MTSPDGITWTARTAAGDNDLWLGVTYGNGLFVAVGASGDRVMTSPDGITWTVRTAAGDNDTWIGVTYGNGLFVAVGASGDRVMTSGKTDYISSSPNNIYQGGLTVNGALAVGPTGVQITTDNDGAITLLGQGDGSDEDLTLNLDDTSNTGVFTSSTGLTNLTFTSIGSTWGGLVTANAGLTVTGAAVSLNASSNFDVNVATGTSTGDITLGGGTAGQLISINSDDWDISTAGVITGVGAITSDGLITTTLGLTVTGAAVNLNVDVKV